VYASISHSAIFLATLS